MAKWYYNLNGYMKGPCSRKEVQSLITQGILTAQDMAYKEGDEEWCEIRSFVDFDLRQSATIQFHENSNLPDPDGEAREGEWLLLLRKNVGAVTEFVQNGPYSSSEIKKMVNRRQVLLSDHIWRKGMARWQRLGWMPEFDRRAMRVKNSPKKILNGIVVLSLIGLGVWQYKFVINQLSFLTLISSQRNARQAEVVPTFDGSEVPSFVSPSIEVLPEEGTEDKIDTNVLVPRAVELPPLGENFDIKISLGERSMLTLTANGRVRDPMQLEIWGRCGEILAEKSFFKRFDVAFAAESFQLDLKKQLIPQGQLKVVAYAGMRKWEKSFFIGEKKTFTADLREHLKDSSHLIRSEKEDLLEALRLHLHLVRGLQEHKQISPSWRSR